MKSPANFAGLFTFMKFGAPPADSDASDTGVASVHPEAMGWTVSVVEVAGGESSPVCRRAGSPQTPLDSRRTTPDCFPLFD